MLRDHFLRKLPHFSRAANYIALRPMVRSLQRALDTAVATIVFGSNELHPVTVARTHLPGRIGGAAIFHVYLISRTTGLIVPHGPRALSFCTRAKCRRGGSAPKPGGQLKFMRWRISS